MIKIIKIIEKFVWVVISLFLILIAITFLPIKGNYRVYTVQSGSMEPTIHTGSLIFVKPFLSYDVDDIVTRATDDPKVTITHRIVSKKEEGRKIMFETKGDANEDSDSEMVNQDKIVGKEIFTLPYIGYPVGYARTMPGFILLIVIPAVIIIYEEIKKIKDELVGRYNKKKEEETPEENYSFEEEYVRPSREDNIKEITFENIEVIPNNIIKVKRKMDL